MSAPYGTVSQITEPSDGDTVDAIDVRLVAEPVWDQHDLVADLTALQAILVPTHGLVRYVRGYGHFVFVTSGTYSASTAASPWILTATDGTAGRWVMDLTADSNKTVVRSFACADANPRQCTARAKTHDITSVAMWAPVDWDSSGANVPPQYAFLESIQFKFNDAEAGSAIGKHVMFALNAYLINGATLSSAKLVLGGQAHVGLPAMMPALGIVRYEPAASTLVSLKSGTAMVDDTSASAAAYDAIHSITLTADQNNTVNLADYLYFAVVCNEGDTNALAELRLRQIVLTMATKGYM